MYRNTKVLEYFLQPMSFYPFLVQFKVSSFTPALNDLMKLKKDQVFNPPVNSILILEVYVILKRFVVNEVVI